MAVAREVGALVASGSFIRKMFETGLRLKSEFGENAVCDFSLGNPSLPPPLSFSRALTELASHPFAGKHAYMPNAGYPDVRKTVSTWIGQEYGLEPGPDHVVMSCGAGGGLNTVLKSILNPGDTVLASLPCFMEYRFYASNHGGNLVTVGCKPDFDLDVEAIEAAITPQTAAFILNSPNNPSGRIYPEATIKKLIAVLERSKAKTGRRIYLISDEPYRAIAYGIKVPSLFDLYPHTLVVYSLSKELSIPGERIGWVAVHPKAEDAQALVDAIVFCTRVLGYVNAPALMQKAVAASIGARVDVSLYQKKRDILCPALRAMGYDIPDPDGTFYAFPKVPGNDEQRFFAELQRERILVVPGSGFGLSGFFRIAYCTDDEVIRRSLPGFQKAIDSVLKGNNP